MRVTDWHRPDGQIPAVITFAQRKNSQKRRCWVTTSALVLRRGDQVTRGHPELAPVIIHLPRGKSKDLSVLKKQHDINTSGVPESVSQKPFSQTAIP